MARPLRIEYAGALYHVTARGNERKRIYFTKSDYGEIYEQDKLPDRSDLQRSNLFCSGKGVS